MANEKIQIELVLDDGSIGRGFVKLETEGKKSAKKIGKFFDKAFKSSFAKFTALLGAGVIARKVTGDFLNFESALAEVRTITQGLGIDQEKLNKQLFKNAKLFGTSATEQAKSFYQIISAGVTDATRATELLTQANKLAIGGLTTTQGAIDLLTSSVNAFGQENLSAKRASDILFTTVKLGKTRIEDLQASLGLILPSASALGVSFEDVAGALAQITTKGLSTSLAVTQLNAVFTAVLKKGGEAERLFGKKFAKETFSLLALQTKGLTKFLKDLNTELGGSAEKLTLLLGRAEGTKAILNLAADGFLGMADKISQLKKDTDAANTAFEEMNNTVGRKLKIIFSIATISILELTSSFSEGLVKALDAVIGFMLNFNGVLDKTINAVIRLTAAVITVGLAINAAFIFKSAIFSMQILLFTIKKTVFELSIFKLLASAPFFSPLWFSNIFAAIGSINLTNVATKLLRASVVALKIAITLGLIVVVDLLVKKFFELQKVTQSTGDAFRALGLKIKIIFLQVFRELLVVLAGFTSSFSQALTTGLLKAFESMSRKISKAKSDFRELTFIAKEAAESITKVLGDITVGPFDENMKGMIATASDLAKKLKPIFRDKIVGLISGSLQTVGASLVNGTNAFKDFGGFILNILGDLAIQVGTIILGMGTAINALAASLASFNGATAIAAGVALIVLGGALKALAKGPSSSSPGLSDGSSNLGGGDAEEGEITIRDQDILQDLNKKPTTINVNVEGNLVDPVGAAIAIADLLKDQFDSNDLVVTA